MFLYVYNGTGDSMEWEVVAVVAVVSVAVINLQ